MCNQYQSASRSFEAGSDFARYNSYTSVYKIEVDAAYEQACKEARNLGESPPEEFAFKLGFESYLPAREESK